MTKPELIRVLYMEDDTGLARLLQKRLEREEFKVDIAGNGKEGVSMYNKDLYDVVLVDSSMPELSGIEVVRVLSSKDAVPPVVMVTGSGNEKTAVEALKLGVSDYIVKDIEGGYLELLPPVIRGTLEKKKMVEETLRMEEEMRRQNRALECAGQAIVMTDLSGKIMYVNPAFSNLTGYTLAEAIGQNPRILKTDRHGSEFYKNMWDTILNGETWSGELTNKRKDGSEFESFLTISPVFDKHDALESFVAVQSNITERILMEEKLKKLSSIVEQTADNIIMTDKNGVIEYANPAFEKSTGYSKEELIGKTPNLLKSGQHTNDFYRELWETVRAGSSFRAEFVNKKRSGELFYEEKTITPIKVKHKSGEHLHFVSSGRDITDRVKLEKAREKLVNDLQKALNNIKTLSGLLPICASCKKIRDDKGYWSQIESYIQERSEAEFTHGICPDCKDKLYPELNSM